MDKNFIPVEVKEIFTSPADFQAPKSQLFGCMLAYARGANLGDESKLFRVFEALLATILVDDVESEREATQHIFEMKDNDGNNILHHIALGFYDASPQVKIRKASMVRALAQRACNRGVWAIYQNSWFEINYHKETPGGFIHPDMGSRYKISVPLIPEANTRPNSSGSEHRGRNFGSPRPH